MTDWPSDWVSPSASTRARMSVEPPAAHGTISVMGFSGQAAWDSAGAASARPNAHARNSRLNRSVMVITPCASAGLDAGWNGTG
ncbi:hypothetical protein G6F57_016351 [Rhizopus arrhizus]|nr:hypothetical protein G6F57_016351 [Rhizopus arrhizus]